MKKSNLSLSLLRLFFSVVNLILFYHSCCFSPVMAQEINLSEEDATNYDLKITLFDLENYQVDWKSGAAGWQKSNWGTQNTLSSHLQIENLTNCRATPTLKFILPDPTTLSDLQRQLEAQNWQLLVWDNQQRSQIYDVGWPTVSRVLPLALNSLETKQLATYQLTLTNQTPIPPELEKQSLRFDLALEVNFQYCPQVKPSTTPETTSPPLSSSISSSATTSATAAATATTVTKTIYQPVETITETTETIYQILGDATSEVDLEGTPLNSETIGWAGSSDIPPAETIEATEVGIADLSGLDILSTPPSIEATADFPSLFSTITGFFATSPILSSLITGLAIGAIGFTVWFIMIGLEGAAPSAPTAGGVPPLIPARGAIVVSGPLGLIPEVIPPTTGEPTADDKPTF